MESLFPTHFFLILTLSHIESLELFEISENHISIVADALLVVYCVFVIINDFPYFICLWLRAILIVIYRHYVAIEIFLVFDMIFVFNEIVYRSHSIYQPGALQVWLILFLYQPLDNWMNLPMCCLSFINAYTCIAVSYQRSHMRCVLFSYFLVWVS